MSISKHIEQLIQKHTSIDSKIHKIEANSFHNESELNNLKKQKLKIKEEIVQQQTNLQQQNSSQQQSKAQLESNSQEPYTPQTKL